MRARESQVPLRPSSAFVGWVQRHHRKALIVASLRGITLRTRFEAWSIRMTARRLPGRTGSVRHGDRPRSDLIAGTSRDRSLDEIMYAVERREILAALARAAGRRTKAAAYLGISRSRLYRRMEALGIERDGA